MSATARITTPVSRRTLLGTAGTAGAAVLLAGCARGTLTRAAPGPDVTLSNDNPTWAPGLTDAGDLLREHTGHGISVRATPDVSSYQQIVRTSARTDSTTDLVKWWNGYRLRDVARSGIFADLSTIWDEAEAQQWVDPTMRETFSAEGTPYAIPLHQSYYAMFYSRPVFEKLGLEPPATWDDFLAVAEELKADGVTPIASGGTSTWEAIIWFQQLVNGIDPDFYTDLTEGRASYLDDVAVEAMEVWGRLYERGFFSPPDFSVPEAPGRFDEGTVGMNLYGTWNANTYVQAGLGDIFGLYMVPPVEPSAPPTIVTESGAIAVADNAHKRDEALEVLASWLRTDVQQIWVDFLNDLSANPDALPSVPAVQDLAAAVAETEPRLATRYWEASPPVMVEGNVKELGAFMASPSTRTARATLRRMQKRAEDEWKKWNL
ncbi:extracellular solute-binding protein [Nesterenkonia halophila]|uniref:ABC transporter substrate-binding protein n=1 Tax=Nesterenkonia halophila TaxID=302044 RepID=UPI001291FA7D|nr:substrate-binding domain-containing protein [Nesterenkonia halophila]